MNQCNYLERNVETLLDFVQTPYFTAEGIEKEKGIITQELLCRSEERRVERV